LLYPVNRNFYSALAAKTCFDDSDIDPISVVIYYKPRYSTFGAVSET
jgi:hypothetical protein